MQPYLKASGELTVQWYAEQPTKPVPQGGAVFTPEPVALVPADRLAISARWALTLADPVVALQGSATRAVFDQSRDTVISNAERERVRWVRHARPNACGFCKMLATRTTAEAGLYSSKRAALRVVGRRGGQTRGSRKLGEKYHDHCFCTAVMVRDGVYDPPEYAQQWKDQYDDLVKPSADGGQGLSNLDDIARALEAKPGKSVARSAQSRRDPVNLDAPAAKVAADAEVAARQLPGLEASLANLRAKGLAEDSPQITWHKEQIARMRANLGKAQ